MDYIVIGDATGTPGDVIDDEVLGEVHDLATLGNNTQRFVIPFVMAHNINSAGSSWSQRLIFYMDNMTSGNWYVELLFEKGSDNDHYKIRVMLQVLGRTLQDTTYSGELVNGSIYWLVITDAYYSSYEHVFWCICTTPGTILGTMYGSDVTSTPSFNYTTFKVRFLNVTYNYHYDFRFKFYSVYVDSILYNQGIIPQNFIYAEKMMDFVLDLGDTEVYVESNGYRISVYATADNESHLVYKDAGEVNNVEDLIADYGTKGDVGTGPTHDYKTSLDNIFKTAFEDIFNNIESTSGGKSRSTNTGNKAQDIINNIQNNVDKVADGVDSSIVWLLKQITKIGMPTIQVLFKGVYDNIENFSTDILGFFSQVLNTTVVDIKHIGDLLITFLNTLTNDLLNITDAEVSYSDLTPYWNLMIEALDYDNDDTVSVYIIGPSIGLTTMAANTLLIPTKLHIGALNLDVDTWDILFTIYWLKHLPILHPTLLGESVPIPLGLLYWTVKDFDVPILSDLAVAFGLIVGNTFFSHKTTGFTVKDGTLPLFLEWILHKLATMIGLDKKYIPQILMLIANRFKVGFKDITGRLKQPDDSNKLNGSQYVISDRLDDDVVIIEGKLDEIDLKVRPRYGLD